MTGESPDPHNDTAAYEKELHEWALHQKPGTLRGAITAMEYGEDGVILTVIVTFPKMPPTPEGLDKQPEDMKATVHQGMMAHWKGEYSISCLKLGPVSLQLPTGINPFLRELVQEENNWADHMDMVEKRKAGAPKPEGG
jgi:hypothetical protein